MDEAAALPQRVGAYEVRAKIAEGGMASIYLARGPQGVVALKLLHDSLAVDRSFVDMFLDEGKIVSRLAHPNVIQTFERGADDERPFLAMELLVGQSLWSVWEACRARNVRLRYDLLAWIGARVAEGLHHAHELRDDAGQPFEVVHRDVNAANVIVTYDGAVKVIDFGLVKATHRLSSTMTGVLKGKLAYMSPEQARGAPIDRRTDVFALGVTLWELSVDRRLFKGANDTETLRAVVDASVPDPATLVVGYPRPLWRVLRKALAKDAAERYATAAEMARDLDACAALEGRVVGAQTLAEVVRALFVEERARQLAWIAEASGGARAPSDSLRGKSSDLSAEPPLGESAVPESLRSELETRKRAKSVWRVAGPLLGLALLGVLVFLWSLLAR